MRRSTSTAARYVQVRLKELSLRRQRRLVLDEITWTIRPGQRWVLVGGNGAGKTQLLKLIAGAVWPTARDAEGNATPGLRSYVWRGETFPSPYEVREEIGYIGPERQDKYERYGWNHTAEQIVGTGLYRTDIPLDRLSATDRLHIGRLLARLALHNLSARPFLSLSYGERRLVLLARILASRPRLLLLDELLSGLDEINHRRALGWLRRTARSHLPWVLATHRVADIPAAATHALALEHGRVVYQGVLQRAPLQRWLSETHTAPDARKHRLASAISAEGRSKSRRWLVRLVNATVYLDGRRILQDLTLEIRAGECWVVHGRNGSGKTTLLRTLYGDHAVARGGRIERAGIVPGVPLQEFRRRVGFVAPHVQSEHPHQLSVVDVVSSGRHASIGLNDRPTKRDRAAAQRSLAFFALSHLTSRPLNELSYGQLRRVLFARAWVCQPRLLLLDEPFSGVDGPTRRALMTHLETIAAGGTALVMSTHHRSEWPACTTHELELAGGRARYCGPVRSVRADSRLRQ